MREYRGQTIKGTFVFGDYYTDNVNSIIRVHYSTNEGDFDDHVVWEDTVGQFIGLSDKNKVKIFEGDIVRILYTDWPSKSNNDPRTIEQYCNDIAKIGNIIFSEDRYWVKVKSKKYDDLFFTESIFPGTHGFIEVIGNIYENPELLK